MADIQLAEIYRREADRLRFMADAFMYYSARDEFLAVARHFDALAVRAERNSPALDETQR